MAIDREATLKIADKFLRAGRLDAAIAEYARVVADQPNDWDTANALSDLYVRAGDVARAAAFLAEFAARVPTHVPTLLKLVEVCLDGGLEEMMFDAQARLADAYLANGSAAEACVIAEDLVARAPGDAAHADRLRRALIALNVEDPEAVVQEHMLIASLGVGRSVTAHALETELTGLEELQAVEPPADAQKTHAPSAPPAPVTSAASGEIDLTTLLGELQAQTPPPTPVPPPARDLEHVFAGLRAEAESEEGEASGDHFDLARTYLDMGMPEQAIGSLEMAARSPRYRFAAASMLAEIYRDNGDLRAAIEWCERAAEVPAPEPERGRSLLYDLADLLETVGETARALAVFLELGAEAPDYRDVRERVTRLSRLETEG